MNGSSVRLFYNDGIMDDLNSDGKLDHRDANILYDIIDKMYGEPWYGCFLGGLAGYKERRGHGPFVHVDTRGFLSRWQNQGATYVTIFGGI